MCQMRVVLEKDGAQQTILENVSLLEVEGDAVRVSALFETPQVVESAQVTKIDFMSGTVTLATRKGQ
ncbi:MAG TPA: CooT family nickel-binding protein [Desulfurivibrionaceae bacterium]|nr:CooT family nickel-binding protein [Desulfurivibrionaceae bacterium]